MKTYIPAALLSSVLAFGAFFTSPSEESVKAYTSFGLSHGPHAPVVVADEDSAPPSREMIAGSAVPSDLSGFKQRQLPETIVAAGPTKNWQAYQPAPIHPGEKHYEISADGQTLIEVE